MFIKYPHVERLGTDEVDGITVGECHIFPKIDGTNASVWLEGGSLCAGSRNRSLVGGKDNAGFFEYVLDSEITDGLIIYLSAHPNHTLYGEFLVSHSLKTYRDDAWRKFYIFDVADRRKDMMQFVPYAKYSPDLESCGLDYIPLLETVTNPSIEHLQNLLQTNTYLIKDGEGAGEGIVIKRYDYANRFRRTTWAKLVRNEFKEQNRKAFGAPEATMAPVEHKIVQEYITEGRVDKIVAKMKLEREGVPFRSRIPELFGRVWYELVHDELWNIVKKYKRPKIDFKMLYYHVVNQVKSLMPELFG